MTSLQWKWAKFAVLVSGCGAVLLALYALDVSWSEMTPARVRSYILSFGWWAPTMYTLLYAQPIVPLPASVMWMAAGLAFGVAGGLALALVAATIRGCGQFLIARLLGREAIETILRGRLASLDARIGQKGFWTVFWIRVIPNVPFDLQNVWLGFSKISLRTFALATLLGLLPGALLWVCLGQTLTDLTHAWKIIGAVLALTVLAHLQRRARARRLRPSSEGLGQ